MKSNRKRCKECKQWIYNSPLIVCGYECGMALLRKKAEKDKLKAQRQASKAEKERKAKERQQKADFRKTDVKWLKANAEYYCNKYIRLRDANDGCISCGTRNPNIVYAAGHFIPKGRCLPLRYNELNIHKQCNNYCNKHLSGNPGPYEAALRIKLGNEVVEWLKGPHDPVRYRAEDYLLIIEHYKQKIKQLKVKDYAQEI